MTGQQEVEDENMMENYLKEESLKPKTKTTVLSKTEPELLNADMFYVEKSGYIEEAFNTSIDMVAVQPFNTSNDELKETTESLLEKIGVTWNCKMCGQKSGVKQTLKKHIESKHTTGGYHPCKVCGKILRFSNSINTHMSKYRTK